MNSQVKGLKALCSVGLIALILCVNPPLTTGYKCQTERLKTVLTQILKIKYKPQEIRHNPLGMIDDRPTISRLSIPLEFLLNSAETTR